MCGPISLNVIRDGSKIVVLRDAKGRSESHSGGLASHGLSHLKGVKSPEQVVIRAECRPANGGDVYSPNIADVENWNIHIDESPVPQWYYDNQCCIDANIRLQTILAITPGVAPQAVYVPESPSLKPAPKLEYTEATSGNIRTRSLKRTGDMSSVSGTLQGMTNLPDNEPILIDQIVDTNTNEWYQLFYDRTQARYDGVCSNGFDMGLIGRISTSKSSSRSDNVFRLPAGWMPPTYR